MAGDHNPRKPVEDRRNKRFFCKLSYSQSKKYLRPGCVGCGRCAWVCPGDIGLPNVVTYIRREITKAGATMSDRNARAIVTIPEVAVIDEIKDEIEDVKTFYFSFDEQGDRAGASGFKSGQFVMCTVFGAGEFAVSLPFSPENDRLHLSVRQVGKVTQALHELGAGDKIGIRGPFGNGFPFEEIKGKNVVYVAGGIGIIPLRSSIVHVLQHRTGLRPHHPPLRGADPRRT